VYRKNGDPLRAMFIVECDQAFAHAIVKASSHYSTVHVREVYDHGGNTNVTTQLLANLLSCFPLNADASQLKPIHNTTIDPGDVDRSRYIVHEIKVASPMLASSSLIVPPPVEPTDVLSFMKQVYPEATADSLQMFIGSPAGPYSSLSVPSSKDFLRPDHDQAHSRLTGTPPGVTVVRTTDAKLLSKPPVMKGVPKFVHDVPLLALGPGADCQFTLLSGIVNGTMSRNFLPCNMWSTRLFDVTVPPVRGDDARRIQDACDQRVFDVNDIEDLVVKRSFACNGCNRCTLIEPAIQVAPRKGQMIVHVDSHREPPSKIYDFCVQDAFKQYFP
jgi:hypothetical protein